MCASDAGVKVICTTIITAVADSATVTIYSYHNTPGDDTDAAATDLRHRGKAEQQQQQQKMKGKEESNFNC